MRGKWSFFITSHPIFTAGGLGREAVFFWTFHNFFPITAEMAAENGGKRRKTAEMEMAGCGGNGELPAYGCTRCTTSNITLLVYPRQASKSLIIPSC